MALRRLDLRKAPFAALASLGFGLASLWVLGHPAPAGAGETNAPPSCEFRIHDPSASGGTRALVPCVPSHPFDEGTGDDSEKALDDVALIANDGPLLSYSLVIVDDPDPLASIRDILASGKPFRFDFETGLQGWKAEGSAQRVNTPLLGGQWAIFGDGLAAQGAALTLELGEPVPLMAVLFEAAYVGEPDAPFPVLGAELIARSGEAETRFFEPGPVEELSPEPLGEVTALGLFWNALRDDGCAPACEFADPFARIAILDNITLVPIPEPATAMAAGLGLAGLALARAAARARCRGRSSAD